MISSVRIFPAMKRCLIETPHPLEKLQIFKFYRGRRNYNWFYQSTACFFQIKTRIHHYKHIRISIGIVILLFLT